MIVETKHEAEACRHAWLPIRRVANLLARWLVEAQALFRRHVGAGRAPIRFRYDVRTHPHHRGLALSIGPQRRLRIDAARTMGRAERGQ